MTQRQAEKLLMQTMEGEVIRSLLSGNDTGCFTTLQYLYARDRWIEEKCGVKRIDCTDESDADLTPMARKQLLSIGLVKEVSPDIWIKAEP